MEKAEILEMTVAYISQLHAARCRSPSSDVITRAPRRIKSRAKAEDEVQEFDRSSSEYRAGFIQCVSHVHSFLADQPAAATELSSELTLPQLLLNHLSQFVVDARAGPKDLDHRVVRSTPPSPDTTLGGTLPSSDPALFLPLASTPPSAKVRRQSLSRCGAPLSASQTVGRQSFLLPMVDDGALRRHQQTGVLREQPTSSDYDTQRRRRDSGVFLNATVPAVNQPSPSSSSKPVSLTSSSTSVSNSQCSSPSRDNAAATCLLPAASPSNAASDVWRPWRPETTTCCD